MIIILLQANYDITVLLLPLFSYFPSMYGRVAYGTAYEILFSPYFFP